MDVYSFPVQIILSHPNGTVIHHINLNEFMAAGHDLDSPDTSDEEEM